MGRLQLYSIFVFHSLIDDEANVDNVGLGYCLTDVCVQPFHSVWYSSVFDSDDILMVFWRIILPLNTMTIRPMAIPDCSNWYCCLARRNLQMPFCPTSIDAIVYTIIKWRYFPFSWPKYHYLFLFYYSRKWPILMEVLVNVFHYILFYLQW